MARSKKCHERLVKEGGNCLPHISSVSQDSTGISGFHRYIGISPVSQGFAGFSGFRWFLRVSPEKLPSPLAGRGWGGAIRDDGRRNRTIFIQVI